MTATAAVPTSDLDPFSDDFLDDPYRGHQALRDAGPVVYLERYCVWAFARFEQVQAVLTDPDTFCSGAGVGLSDFRKEVPWRPPSLLLEADAPEHGRARNAITKVLSPKVVKTFRGAFLAEAESLVDRLLAKGTFDAIEDLAVAFPLKVFPDVVGLPPEGRENLLAYGNMAFNGFGPRNHLFEEAMVEAEAVQEWIGAHCESDALSPDGIGALIHRAAPAEGALLVRSFLTAGVDTTVGGLGNAVLCLAANPAQWRALRADPGLAKAAFEETIRFESPVQTFFRTTTREVTVAGVTLPAGEKVLTFLGAANRDPREWADADVFDITRRAAGHVGFGVGTHACVGQMLARLEGEAVLGTLARRVETLDFAGSPVRALNNTLRSLRSLPIRIS